MAEVNTSTGTPGTAPEAPQPGGGIGGLLIVGVPMAIIFYLLLIRPESKRRKEREALINAVKVKDKIVTIGGVYATVVEIDEKAGEIVLLLDPKKDVRIRAQRSAIAAVNNSADEKN